MSDEKVFSVNMVSDEGYPSGDTITFVDEHAGQRFCGRCQAWRSEPIGELHHCVKAPRKIGYEWRERVVSGGGKLTPDEKLPRYGKLIERFEAEAK